MDATTGDQLTATPFAVPGTAIYVGNDGFVVYVYPSPSEQERIQITDGGSMVSSGERGLHIDWPYPPHFVRKGNILVTISMENADLVRKIEAAVKAMK